MQTNISTGLLRRARRVIDALPPSAELIVIALGCVFLTAAYAVWAGQDVNWDQRNYHVYAPFAWLNGRMDGIDVAPAQLQNWFNPLGTLFHYLALTHLPPVVAGGLFGAVAGLNGALVYALARRLIDGGRLRVAVMAALCAALAVSSPMFLSEAGTTFIDNILSLTVLGALLLIVNAVLPADGDVRRQKAAFAAAGLLLGMSVGLKLTMASYALGIGFAALLCARGLRLHFVALLALAGGGIAGYLLTGGFWAATLWVTHGNPVFPFYNAVFQSPDVPPVNIVDARFLPKSFTEALSYPFQWLAGRHPSAEVPFRDARFAVLALLLPFGLVSLALAAVERRPVESPARPVHGLFLLLAFTISFVLWISAFGIHRYVIPLELLCGLAIFLCLNQLMRNRRAAMALFAVTAVAVIVWGRPADWGRLRTYPAESWYGIKFDRTPEPGAMYVMLGADTPIAYVIPSLPQARAVRISGNMPLEPGFGVGQRALEAISSHQGPLRTLAVIALEERERTLLARFGLRLDADDCLKISVNFERLFSCRLERLEPTDVARR